MRTVVALSAIVLLAACRSRDGGTKTEPTATMTAATAATPATIASAAAAIADSGADDGAADRASHAVYLAAIARGRTATTAKQWPAAIKAFTEAIAARPHDSRALAERGYAELLSGDREKARADLQDARWTHDAGLGAQVWFNLGLVDESPDGGVTESAVLDFWVADHLKSSTATRAKLAGREVCPLGVDRTAGPAKKYSSWLAAITALGSEGRCNPPKSEAEAKALAGPPVTVGTSKFHFARAGKLDLTDCIVNTVGLVQVEGADLWLWVFPGGGGTFVNMLPSEPNVTLIALTGAWSGVRATTTQDVPDELYMCTTAQGGEVFECRGDPGEIPAGMAHPSRHADAIETFYDAAKHAVVLTITDRSTSVEELAPGGKRAIDFRPVGGAVQPVGLGCKTPIPIGP